MAKSGDALLSKAAGINPPGADDDTPATRPEWAARITAAWQKSVESILEVGRLLNEAKAALTEHGEWEAMVDKELPFGLRTAEMLMRVGRDEQLTKHVSLLPPSWGTLHALTQLAAPDFDDLIAEGKLTPELQRHEVETFRREREHAHAPTTALPLGSGANANRPKKETPFRKQKEVIKFCDALDALNAPQRAYVWADVLPHYPAPSPAVETVDAVAA